MPYKNDPRRTVTLNFFPDEYAVLSEDALEAGYATPGTFAKALVLARGAAPAPVVDRRSEERLGRLEGKLSIQQALLAAAEARARALQDQLQAARHELSQRPSLAAVRQAVAEAVAAHHPETSPPVEASGAEAAALVPAAPAPEEEADARRRRVRKRQREAERVNR